MHLIKRKLSSLLFAAGIIFAALLACRQMEPVQEISKDPTKIQVTTTTTMLADLASVIGGSRVQVAGLMGPGIDPHAYQASAGDVAAMQNADIVVYNGLHLEGKMGDVFSALRRSGRGVICIEDGLAPDMLLIADAASGAYDPHIWFDVALWKQAAAHMAYCLAEYDPVHRADYAQNLKAYLSELDMLEQYIRERISEIPQNQRILITAHDAFGYLGRAYGLTVVGLQGISTNAEAGTADVSSLAAYIAENRIGAVFAESSIPPKTIASLQAAVLASGHNVRIGGELYSDSLGDEASGTQTYVQTVRYNIDTIVQALK